MTNEPPSRPSIRPLEGIELVRVCEIDVSEAGSFIYRQTGRATEKQVESWERGPRDVERWAGYVDRWAGMLRAGGVALGAFTDRSLIGATVGTVSPTR